MLSVFKALIEVYTYPNQSGKIVINAILDDPLSSVTTWVNSFDGTLDWELPTISEMVSIIDLHKNNVNFTLSSLIESAGYWTSEQGSCDSGYTTIVWYVNSFTDCKDNVSSYRGIPVSNF